MRRHAENVVLHNGTTLRRIVRYLSYAPNRAPWGKIQHQGRTIPVEWHNASACWRERPFADPPAPPVKSEKRFHLQGSESSATLLLTTEGIILDLWGKNGEDDQLEDTLSVMWSELEESDDDNS